MADSTSTTPTKTTLDTSVAKPSTTAPGDGPADTTDPTEIAQSVPATPGAEALAVGTVNAVKPVKKATAKKVDGEARTERYKATKPDGTEVTIERNIDTGVSAIVAD